MSVHVGFGAGVYNKAAEYKSLICFQDSSSKDSSRRSTRTLLFPLPLKRFTFLGPKDLKNPSIKYNKSFSFNLLALFTFSQHTYVYPAIPQDKSRLGN
jgi:hypothetical protein